MLEHYKVTQACVVRSEVVVHLHCVAGSYPKQVVHSAQCGYLTTVAVTSKTSAKKSCDITLNG